MSLDFYLYQPRQINCPSCRHCIEVSGDDVEIFSRNITHNLGKMASEAGIYEALWHPDRKGWKIASDVVEVLEKGLTDLKSRPDFFKTFDSPNGWGIYEHFIPFVEAVLAACKNNPAATIYTST